MELQQNFDLANENLIRLFSKYTKPIQMDKCTCSACIKDHSPKQFDWFEKNEKKIEELFWSSEDPRVQKLFSDVLPPNISQALS